MTKEQALALASARLRLQQQKPSVDREAIDADMQRMADPTSGMGFLEKFNAGMGKAFTDLGRGAGQMVGLGPNAQEVHENRRLDAPLMKTGAGVAGNISGNIAALAPLAVIPGAATVSGAGALGSVAGGLQPTEGAGDRLVNIGVGGLLGGGTQFLGSTGARMLGERAAAKEAALKAQQQQNTVRDETIRRGREAGYVVPPSAVNEPSFLGGRLESLGGKAALGQEASLRNQSVTDALARKAAGLGDDQAISAEALRAARKNAAAPYREISALNPRAASELESAQAARAESKLQWKHYNRSAEPAAHKAATSADAQAKRALDAIEQEAVAAGKPELVEQLKLARALIARNHQVQNALNRGTGNVDASVLGRALDSGAPLSGGLETIGRYQQAFPQFTREASKVPSPGVGKTELLAAALLGGGGGAAAGPLGALAGLAPFAAGPTRSALLSNPVQNMLAQPNYKAGAFTRGTAALSDQETQRRLALLLRSLALPAIPQAVNE
jgi:hypothetical protein